MCTVTYLPLAGNNFLLTSSRDVSIHRPRAAFPSIKKSNTTSLLLPEDGQAGGTWIGLNQGNRAVVLLNGGFEGHLSKPPYAKSRGLVVREILEAKNYWNTLQDYVFNGIEPFTLLILDWQTGFFFYELVWDGERKFLKQLNPNLPQIWSSSTLYTAEMRKTRKVWFEDWFRKPINFTKNHVLDFHENAGKGDPNMDIFLRRDEMQTVSISCIEKQQTFATFFYYDTLSNDFSNTFFEFENTPFISQLQ